LTKSVHIKEYKSAFANIPAIVVSAGPALNKNVHLLKELYNKAVIISAGSALTFWKAGALHPILWLGWTAEKRKAEYLTMLNPMKYICLILFRFIMTD